MCDNFTKQKNLFSINLAQQRTFSKILTNILVLILITISIIFIIFPVADHLGQPLGRNDYLHNIWVLTFNSQVMFKNPLNIFDTAVYYPLPSPKPFHEIQIGNSLIFSIFYYLSNNPILSFNLFILISIILTAFSMYLFINELTKKKYASIFVSLIFISHQFYIWRFHYSQLIACQWIFFTFFYLAKYFKSFQLKHLVPAGIFYAMQNTSFGYLTVGMNIYIAGFLITNIKPIISNKKRILQLAVLGIIEFFIALPFYLPFLKLASEGFIRSIKELEFFGADLLNYFITESVLYYKFLLKYISPDLFLNVYFPGFIVFFLAILGFYKYAKNQEKTVTSDIQKYMPLFVILFFFFFFVTLGPFIKFNQHKLFPSPLYPVFNYTPLFSGTHSIGSYFIFVFFSVSMIIAYFISNLKMAKTTLIIICLLTITGIEIENHVENVTFTTIIPAYPQNSALEIKNGKYIPEVYQWLSEQPGKFAIIEFPLMNEQYSADSQVFSQQYNYQYYSIFHRKNIVNGVEGFWPGSYTALLGMMSKEFPSQKTIEYLREIKVKYILLHKENYKNLQYVSAKLKKIDIVSLKKSFDSTYVFEIQQTGKKWIYYRILPRTSWLQTGETEMHIEVVSHLKKFYPLLPIECNFILKLENGNGTVKSYIIKHPEIKSDGSKNIIPIMIKYQKKLKGEITAELLDVNGNLLAKTNYIPNTNKLNTSYNPDILKYQFVNLGFPKTAKKKGNFSSQK